MSKTITYDGSDIFYKEATEWHDEIKVIVPSTHCAILIKNGVMLNTLDSGTYILEAEKKSLFKRRSEPSLVEIVFAVKTARLKIEWGTKYLLNTRDCVTGELLKIGLGGEMELAIGNPRKAFWELAVTSSLTLTELRDRLVGRIVGEIEPVLTSVMRESNISYDRLAEYKHQVSGRLLPIFDRMLMRDYGLRALSFGILRTIVEDRG